MTLNLTETVLLLFVVLGVVWPLCTIRETSPTAGTAGSQGEGTGTPDRPAAERPEEES